MKKYILYFILLFSTGVFAQKGSIQGKVFDAKTNEPIEFATLSIQGTTIGSTSDLNGNYIFTGIDPGFVKIKVSLVGYQTTESPELQVQGNQTVYMDIAVEQSAKMLTEVEVRQTVANLKKIESPLSVLTVGVQEIEKGAGVNRDVSKLIQTLPGVGVTDPNRNDLIVRGGGPSENVFYLDGIEIPVINHFTTQGSSGGAVGVINPDFVKDISFYTGAFPANRTNALSSVMEIRQKDGSKDRIHSKLSVGASDAAFTLDGPIGKKSTFIVSARQSYLQFLFDAIGLPFLPTYNDFQFKYKYEIDKKNQLTIIGIGALDNSALNLTIDNPSEAQSYLLGYLPEYKQWNYTVGAVYKHFADEYTDTWVISRNMLRNGNYKYQNNDNTLPKTFNYISDEAENKLRFERNYSLGEIKFLWGGGLKYARYTNETDRQLIFNNQIVDFHYDTNIKLFGYQAFVQASDNFLDEKLRLSLGISTLGNNYNKNMSNPLNQISPRLSASYSLTNNLNLNANIGRYAMQPAYTTLGFKDKNGAFVNQNENLRFTISNQAVAGLEFKPKDNVRLTVEGFYKQYMYYPLSVADGLSIASKGAGFGQIGDEEIVSTGKGRAYGVEFLFKVMELGNLNLTTTLTLFRSEFSDKNGKYIPSSWDTRRLVNLIASYKLPGNWNIAGRWRYSGGAPYSPIVGQADSLVMKAAWDITNQSQTDYANFNTYRLRLNHQLDLRIDKEFYFNKWLLNLYADVQNVYIFKSQNAPVWTKATDANGQAVIVRKNNIDYYKIRPIKDNYGGTLLPTIGIIIKI